MADSDYAALLSGEVNWRVDEFSVALHHCLASANPQIIDLAAWMTSDAPLHLKRDSSDAVSDSRPTLFVLNFVFLIICAHF